MRLAMTSIATAATSSATATASSTLSRASARLSLAVITIDGARIPPPPGAPHRRRWSRTSCRVPFALKQDKEKRQPAARISLYPSKKKQPRAAPLAACVNSALAHPLHALKLESAKPQLFREA